MTIPNAISLSRIVLFTPAIVLAGMNELWLLALVLMLFGAFTDFLDGEVARRTGKISKFGGDMLDPLGDFAITAGAVAGLFFADLVGWTFVFVAIGISVVLQSLRIWGPFWFWLADTLLRVYYLGGLAFLYFWYADLALNGMALIAFNAALAAGLAVLVYIRHDHIKGWLKRPEPAPNKAKHRAA